MLRAAIICVTIEARWCLFATDKTHLETRFIPLTLPGTLCALGPGAFLFGGFRWATHSILILSSFFNWLKEYLNLKKAEWLSMQAFFSQFSKSSSSSYQNGTVKLYHSLILRWIKSKNKTINFGCRVESHHKIERIFRIHKMLGADEKCGKKRTRRIEELKFLSLSSPNWLRMKTI